MKTYVTHIRTRSGQEFEITVLAKHVVEAVILAVASVGEPVARIVGRPA